MENRQWSGKTGGGSFGQKFLFRVLRHIRVSFLYPVLYIAIPFYWLFGKKGRKAIMCYFTKHQGYTYWEAVRASLKNHLTFGKIVLDKFALLAENTNQFKITVEDIDLFTNAINQPEGFFVVSAHIGNFELAGHCLRQEKKQLYGIVYSGESQVLQTRRAAAFQKSHLNLIPVSNDMSHLFAIKNAIDNGDIVTLPCDRLLGSTKSYSCDFFEGKAEFPIGTFRLAAQLDAPVFIVFMMKEKGLSYRGFVKKLSPIQNEKASAKKAEFLAKQYVNELENILKQYPEQWFNYYDFWNELNKNQ